jgi:hypothetical protein
VGFDFFGVFCREVHGAAALSDLLVVSRCRLAEDRLGKAGKKKIK